MRTGAGKGAIAERHIFWVGNAQACAGLFLSGGSFGFVDLPRGGRGSYLRCIVKCLLLYGVRAQVCVVACIAAEPGLRVVELSRRLKWP